MSLTFLFTVVSFVFLPFAGAHIALWDKSMFGLCGKNRQCVNQADPTNPLVGLTFDQWWWHGYLNYPPVNNDIMALPAGKSVTVQLAGNSAWTKVGQHPEAFWPGGAKQGQMNEAIENNHAYWSDGGAGNLHTSGHSDIAGCVLSIAYTDNAKTVRPEDMVVFSVQHECVWHRDTVFDVPADMPPCPNGKCMCSWWWIHNSNGGLDQIYQTPFQCNITYAQGQKVSTTAVGRPVPATNCANDPSKCIKGPKLPMYWKQKECNNMPEPGHFAPTYNTNYGFAQGAQNDIFQTVNKSNWTCPQSKAAGVFPVQHKRETAVPLRHRQAKRRSISG
ncbi:hypothetical protein JB92DRAFT_2898387 [Gautieria morchelliformis]|nr:hypothetical protein JB92DRAFT_2898387 [Gautieria morchelliformis]